MADNDSQTYSRVYHRLMTEYPEVWSDARLVGRYVQLLVLADKFWPERAPIGRQRSSEKALIAAGLVILHDEQSPFGVPVRTYSVRGLDAERIARSNAGRNAAAMRWAMPRREETRIEEQSNGQSPPQTFMGWKPLDRSHHGQHPDCLVCHPLIKEEER